LKRKKSTEDRRAVIVTLEPRGEKLLEEVVRRRIIELRAEGRALVEAIGALLEQKK
jgi:DNA-binding MarR family transcriptional regulator